MTPDEIFGVLTNTVYEVEPELEDTPLTRQDSLRELGVSSMSRVEIAVLAMDSLKIRVPNEALARAKNLGDLVELFSRHLDRER